MDSPITSETDANFRLSTMEVGEQYDFILADTSYAARHF